MQPLPAGEVTFVFADIEASTRLNRALGSGYPPLLEAFRTALTRAVTAHGGVVVSGEGDEVFAAFTDNAAAVSAVRAAQAALERVVTPAGHPLRARMGLHRGEALPSPSGYVSLAVNLSARVTQAAHGGQVLATAAVAGDASGSVWHSHGSYLLKDFDEPIELLELELGRDPASGIGIGRAPRALSADARGLPAFSTSFVGRTAELIDLAALVRQHHLVTVTGAGGSGKTRLVTELTAALAASFDGGAQMVLLAGIRDPAELLPRIAAGLGISATANRLLDAVVEALAARRMLIVLDNCEQVVDEAARVVAAILSRAPSVTIVTTSREPLRLSGEQVWRIPLLGVPTEDPEVTLGELLENDAVRLFCDRAQQARDTFRLDESTALDVARICRGLEGMPLALELAAARVAHVSVRDLAGRLERRLGVLTRGHRDLPDRQRTLRATLEWSHDLLSEPERLLFARLAVFRAPMTLAAIEAVCAGEGIERADVLDLVSSLIDRSLLSLIEGVESRYRMLVVVAEFAAEQLLDSGQLDTVSARHASHISTTVAALFTEPDTYAGNVAPLLDDVDAALEFAIAHGETREAWTLAHAFFGHRYFLGLPDAGRRSRQVLDLAGLDDEQVDATLYDVVLGFSVDGAYDAAEPYAIRLLDRARTSGEPGLRARAHHLRADVLRGLGRFTEAESHYREALATAKPVRSACILRSLGDLAQEARRFEEAESTYREAARVARVAGSRFELARCQLGLGWLLAQAGDSRAREVLGEACDLALRHRYAEVLAEGITGLALLAWRTGDLVRAGFCLAVVRRLADRRGLRGLTQSWRVLRSSTTAELLAALPVTGPHEESWPRVERVVSTLIAGFDGAAELLSVTDVLGLDQSRALSQA